MNDSFIYLHNRFFSLLYEEPTHILELIKILVSSRNRKDFPLDRSNIISCPLHIKNVYPIPDVNENFSKSLTDVCNNEAKNIINEDKPINIFWSGGVDSTTAVISFLNECKDLSQLHITLTRQSINEYPMFYNKYIKQLNHSIVKNYIYKHFSLHDCNLVTGHPAGLLFGLWTRLNALLEQLNIDGDPLTVPWQEIFNTDFPVLGTKKNDEFFVDRIPEFFKNAPFPIETIGDMQWWLCFTTKWQGEVLGPLRFEKELSEKTFTNYKPFYVTMDFQRWGLNNYCKNIRKSPMNTLYRHELKEVIYNFTKDEDYYWNKKKINSGYPAFSDDPDLKSCRPSIDAIDDKYNGFAIDDVKSSLNLKEELKERFMDIETDHSKWILKTNS